MEQVKSSDGTTISFERTGSGEPVLLVHGTTANTEAWTMVVPPLAERFTVVAMNRRGSAPSGETEEHSLDLEADDVAAVVEAIGEPPHIVGHSMGARVVLHAAMRGLPARSLVLYEPPIALTDSDLAVADRADAMIEAGDRNAAAQHFLSEAAAAPQQEIDILASLGPVWERITGNAHLAPRDIRTLYSTPVNLADVPNVEAPVLILVGGEQTAPVYLDGLDEIEAALPNARRVTIAGQRHFANAFAPQEFADAVASFVTSVGAGAGASG